MGGSTMKARAMFSLAVAAIGLSPDASAQTRAMRAHDETASAMRCLLDHGPKECRSRFVGSARQVAAYWLWWTSDKDFALGPLLSSEYAGTQAVNAYTTRVVDSRQADVYGVMFRHQKKTFYIVPPGPDGRIRYMHVRGGDPDEEKMYSPG